MVVVRCFVIFGKVINFVILLNRCWILFLGVFFSNLVKKCVIVCVVCNICLICLSLFLFRVVLIVNCFICGFIFVKWVIGMLFFKWYIFVLLLVLFKVCWIFVMLVIGCSLLSVCWFVVEIKYGVNCCFICWYFNVFNILEFIDIFLKF